MLPCERSPLAMVALNGLAGLAVVVAVSLASARAEEPPRLSLQNTSDFASYGAFYTDLTATYSPFGNLWEPGWRVQGIASARRYSFIDSGTKRIGLDTTLDGLMEHEATALLWCCHRPGISGSRHEVWEAIKGRRGSRGARHMPVDVARRRDGRSGKLDGPGRHARGGREGDARILQAGRHQPVDPRLRSPAGRDSVWRRTDPAPPRVGGGP